VRQRTDPVHLWPVWVSRCVGDPLMEQSSGAARLGDMAQRDGRDRRRVWGFWEEVHWRSWRRSSVAVVQRCDEAKAASRFPSGTAKHAGVSLAPVSGCRRGTVLPLLAAPLTSSYR